MRIDLFTRSPFREWGDETKTLWAQQRLLHKGAPSGYRRRAIGDIWLEGLPAFPEHPNGDALGMLATWPPPYPFLSVVVWIEIDLPEDWFVLNLTFDFDLGPSHAQEPTLDHASHLSLLITGPVYERVREVDVTDFKTDQYLRFVSIDIGLKTMQPLQRLGTRYPTIDFCVLRVVN